MLNGDEADDHLYDPDFIEDLIFRGLLRIATEEDASATNKRQALMALADLRGVGAKSKTAKAVDQMTATMEEFQRRSQQAVDVTPAKDGNPPDSTP